jgi:hypothetical protein
VIDFPYGGKEDKMTSYEFTGTYTLILEADSQEAAQEEADALMGNAVYDYTIEEA